MQAKRKIVWIGVLSIFLLGMNYGCVSVDKRPNKYSHLFPGSKANIRYEIAPEAEITAAKYFIGPWKGKDYLQFEIEIKNISKIQHRYRVSIFLDEGPAIAGLYPRRVKKGKTIQPGALAKEKMPMLYTKEPKGLLVKVENHD